MTNNIIFRHIVCRFKARVKRNRNLNRLVGKFCYLVLEFIYNIQKIWWISIFSWEVVFKFLEVRKLYYVKSLKLTYFNKFALFWI